MLLVPQVRAVEHPKLNHYVDVIVVSTKSHVFNGKSLDRHLASLTGGGKRGCLDLPIYQSHDRYR